jgi:uncharacterized membrane protein
MSTDTKAGDLLKQASQDALQALGSRVTRSLGDGVSSLTDRFDSIAEGGPLKKAVVKGAEAKAQGDSPLVGGLKGAVSGIKDKITGGGGKSGGGGKATKSTNIEETIDVGVPIRVAYNQWTEFGSFPSMMKKVENVEAPEDTRLTWKAQIFWSHRTWESTILEQVPDSHIVWRSKGEKGYVDGGVTFHELAPNLTRILVALEYYPQGFFEKTGNIWEAQGRRARAELRHFRRHVMTRTILEPDEVEGWRGTIEDGEVVETHEEALEREEQEEQEGQDQDAGEQEDYEGDADEEPAQDEYDEESEDEEEPAEDEYDEEVEDEDEPADEDAEYEEAEGEEPAEDEYDEEVDEAEEEPAEDEYEEAADEYEEDEAEADEDERPRRRRRSA